MFGWIATNLNSNIDEITDVKGDIFNYVYEDVTFYLHHNKKYKNDIIFEEIEDLFILLDGVILNKKELEKTSSNELKNIIYKKYYENKTAIPNLLRGQFSGLIFNKIDKSFYFFTNHIGDGAVFYYNKNNKVILSSNFNFIVKVFRKENIPYTLSMEAVKYLYTFGFMLDKVTYINEINRLLPSENGFIEDGNLTVEKYFKFTNTILTDESEEDIIENLDNLFRKAVSRSIEKDIEYGYKSVIDLSGGLDARVVNYVAKDMGFENIMNISFSQVDSDEYKAMMSMSRDLKNPIFFYPLDKASHIYRVDDIVSLNYGLSFFAGVGALVNILELINTEHLGIENGGILGDMAEGVFPGKTYKSHTKPTFESGMPFCRVFDLDILDKRILDGFENTEMFTIFGRGMMGGACTQIIRRNFTPYISPFEDVEFYSYFLKIPLHIRGERAILKRWIKKKHPSAFDIIEDKLMCKPTHNEYKIKLFSLKKKVKNRLYRYFAPNNEKHLKNNMNPMDYWYDTDEKLRLFIEQYYNDNISKLENYKEAYDMSVHLYNNYSIKEKLIVMTLLSVMKQYF